MTPKNNHKLRIGIVGAGSIVRARHLPALKKHPEVEIVAVSNLTYESSEKFCRENLPHATPMQNWADLLAIPDLDIIWIGTPPYMHSAVTISALEAGKLGERALHVVDLAPELEGEWRVEEDFLAAVKSKGRVRPRPNFEEGVRYMRVVQAVADSRARNEWVEIKK